MNGIINILKPTGMTSHDVVYAVRKILNTKKVGHAGTLDPNVAGVLVICVNKGTKISEELMMGDKEYVCEIVLGQSTDTQDSYGKTTATNESFNISKAQLEATLEKFIGEQLQTPPAYSAVKLNGRKLYEYARENIIVEKEAKKVTINKLELIKFNGEKALLKVNCSKGTYMRTLCNDIGENLGCYAHMGVLVRTMAKGLHINDSVTLDELRFLYDNNRIDEFLISIDTVHPLEKIYIGDNLYDRVVTGNEIYYNKNIKEEEFYIYCKNNLIGIGKKVDSTHIKIDKMLL